MSEMGSVNILPGPHGGEMRARLGEPGPNEPLLENCAGNERRAMIIQRARDDLAGRGCWDDASYARAIELLDMLTPTSGHAAWCKLRDELVRLGDGTARLVGPECELVKSDTLRGISRDSELVPKLREECSQFLRDHWSRLSDFERSLEGMMRDVDGRAKGGARTRECIVDMARFGSGADDMLVLRVILAVYVESGMYAEACAACEDILGFDGEDKNRMVASTLVERVVDNILLRLSEAPAKDPDGTLVRRCVGILKRRSDDLGLNRVPGRETDVRGASRLASSIIARRRLKTAEEVDTWIRVRYPLSYEFLNLGDMAGRLLETGPRLVEHVSAYMRHEELVEAGRRSHRPKGALDELERLLQLARERGLDRGRGFKEWGGAMGRGAPWGAISKARICLRLSLEGTGAELRPPTDNGASADLRMGGCHLKVLALGEATPSASRQRVGGADLASSELERVLDGSRPDSAGDRTEALIMDCPPAAFDSPWLRRLVSSKIVGVPRLAGAFLVMFRGGRYRSTLVKNPAAARPITRETADAVVEALKTKV